MRRFLKISFILVLILVIVLGGAYLYLFYGGGIEKVVTNEIQSVISDKYNLDIKIGDIGGDLANGVIIKDIVIEYTDSIGTINLLEIKRLLAQYSLRGLLSGSYQFDLLQIDSVKLRLVEKSQGGWRLPALAPGGIGDGGIPSGIIENLQLNEAGVTIEMKTDTLRFSEMTLAASLQIEGNTFSANLNRFSVESNLENLQIQHCSGKVTFTESFFSFQDFSIGKGDSRLKLDGRFNIKKMAAQLRIAADNLDINEISGYAGINLHGIIDLNGDLVIDKNGLSGSVDIGGRLEIAEFKNLHVNLRFSDEQLYLDTVYGTILDKCAIDGFGKIDFRGDDEYELAAAIRGFNLNSLIQGTFESDLNGEIRLKGSSFSGNKLKIDADVGFYESSFNDYHMHSAMGSMLITADSIVFYDPFVIKYFENVYELNGAIDYKDSLDIALSIRLNNLERYQGKLFIDKPAGRGFVDAHLTGRTSEPDLHMDFKSDSVWIYGLFSQDFNATADISRFLTGKEGTVSLSMHDGSAWDIPVDSGFAYLTIDSNLVFLDTVRWANAFSTTMTKGLFDYEALPMRLNLDTLALTLFNQQFFNRGTLNVNIDSIGFDFKQAAITNQDALLTVLGRVGYDESMDVRLHFDELLVSPWMRLFTDNGELDGIVSGNANVRGSFQQPSFGVSMEVDSLTYRNVNLGILTTEVQYADQLLSVDSLVLLSERGRYSVVGNVPLDLSFTTTTVKRLLDNPMNLKVSAYDKEFDLVTTLLPSVEQLEGDFVTDFNIFGTPNDPHLEGMAYIRNARLKYFDIEEFIYSDSAGVRMQDNKIVIDLIETYSFKRNKKNSPKRNAQIEGEIVVKTLENLYYDIYVTLLRDNPFTYELADIRGSAEGELHIEGDTPPTVTGDLSLVAMRYAVNFASPDEGSPIMTALVAQGSWDLNINIDILSNYWIKNDDIDAQFTGFINLIRDNGQYRFIGELEVIRGRGFLFDKVFRLESGGTVSFEGGDSLNPRLDLIGYTRIAGFSQSDFAADRTSRQILVGVHVTGTLDHPEINPTEDSEVSTEELLPVLFTNYYSTDEAASSGRFQQQLSGLVASQVSQIGTRQLRQLGVETFEIDPGYYQGEIDLSRTRFTLGFYTPFDPNLYVYGRSALGSSTGQEVGFEYRLYKKFLLEGSRNEEELYHLHLKLHWEF